MPYKLVFADQEIADRYNILKNGTSAEQKLHENLKKQFEQLKTNLRHCTYVDRPMQDSRKAKQLKKRYDLNNLWKCNIIDGWRLVYSISSDGKQQIGIIVDWMTHAEYDRLFGYN